jgi:hypothetical protein
MERITTAMPVRHGAHRAAVLLLTAAISCLAVNYHVAKTGNDANAGSSASPFLTINKAAQVAQPGDSVIVHAGEYREWVQPARGGTSESVRITYKAAPGEAVVIKGSERITTWQLQSGNVWKADVPDNMFGSYHPYTMNILGRYPSAGAEWLTAGSWCHLGEVYLDNQIFLEKQTLAEIQNVARTWYTSHSGATTSMYANFGANNNPNSQLAEISVRESVFGNPNATTGVNYVTVDGFTMMQSAEEWTPFYIGNPLISHAVIFVSGDHWIIQNCTVKFGKMRGISIDGANRATYQIVRNNVVTEIGVAGIGGNYAHYSIVTGNWITHIHGARPYYGAEQAGIKIHQSEHLIIAGNVIYNVNSPQDGQGYWGDWIHGGNRFMGNVILQCSNLPIRLENSFGTNFIDNNIIVQNGGAGWMDLNPAAVVHNLLVRTTINGSGKSFNNICISNGGGDDYNACFSGAPGAGSHGVSDNTAPGFSFAVDTAAKTVTLNFTVGAATANLACPVITTNYLGTVGSSRIMNPDSTPLTVDKDFFQNCRGAAPRIGPFQDLKAGLNTFVLRANSNFDFKALCGQVTAGRLLRRPLMTNGNRPAAYFDMRGRLIPGMTAGINARNAKGRGVYVGTGITGEALQRALIIQ